uniref:RING-CH-type domain-containing protein n=1 Tax=Steinernema glaseri TaxID=37863 RepID=A0A1I8A8Q9_9BILA
MRSNPIDDSAINRTEVIGLEAHESREELLRQCKYCYSDETIGRWMTPCKCAGSIRYVHSGCFSHWLSVAPFQQQSQCNTCKHIYKKHWSLKGFREWSVPRLDVTWWDTFEILLDFYSTFKLVRGFIALANGRRSILGQVVYFVFWKTFILTEQRSQYYIGMGRAFLSCFFKTVVDDVALPEEGDDAKSERQCSHI